MTTQTSPHEGRQQASAGRAGAHDEGTPTVIDVTDLRSSYGEFEAVRGVSFSVGKGELFALLGTNGAGKTTTMETLEGHRVATAGAVRVLGMDPVRDRSTVRRRVGIMLQESGFAGDLTVAETLRLWADLSSRTDDEGACLARLGLDDRRDVAVKALSGGERRRLDLALALWGEPEVLFLDEPTTGLDPESRHAVWGVVAELLRDGSTIVLTTHYLEEAQALADRVAIMHEGRIVVAGTVAEVVTQRPARIDFTVAALPAHGLPPLRGDVTVRADDGQRVSIRTHELQTDLTTVLTWARDAGLALDGISAQAASLDDVFRDVTSGRLDGNRSDQTTKVTR